MENKKPKINLKILYLTLIGFFLFFGTFILINEYTLNYGEEVFLKTIPVDPRDLLRGDYVILNYEIQLDEKIKNIISNQDLKEGDIIYLLLKKDKNNLGKINNVLLNAPKKGQLFLKGKLKNQRFSRGLGLDFGIGKYFIPEGRGWEVERLSGKMEVLISVDKFGTSIIKGLYFEGKLVDFKNKSLI